MKRISNLVGALALFAWTALGALAWWQATGHWTLVVQEGERPDESAAARELALLDEKVVGLATDVHALAEQLEKNLGVLDERGEERARGVRAALDERAEALARELAAQAQRIAALGDELRQGQDARAQDPNLAPEPAALDAAPEVAPESFVAQESTAPPVSSATPDGAGAPEPATRASFLAFRLPSDDFRFDERRTWTVVPALSRVGFDAKSTLHDFSGTTSEVSGSVSVELAHAERAPKAQVAAEAASLKTGEDGRDESMRDDLAAADHPRIEFELASFAPERVDAAAGKVTGRAHGRLRIRGVEREVELEVALALDDAHRLSIDGELELALPDYGVPVPSKLGLIRMEERVRVWLALRARLEPKERE